MVAFTLAGVGALQSPGRLDVFLEPAGAVGADPFMVLESPDLRVGDSERLALDGGVTIRTGIEPGLYGGSGSDHLCDPQLIADFLAQDADKAAAWASAAGIEVDEIESFLDTLTPVRLLADTWVTNHGYRDGQATPRQSILQAGSLVLVDEFGVPRVRCKCGNPLQPPQVPDDMDRVDFVGEPWEDFDPDQLLVVEPGDEPVEWFILVRLEDGRLIARPVGTTGDQDVLVDDDLNWLPELDLELPSTAAVGDGPFPLPAESTAGLEVTYEVDGPCRIVREELVVDGEGLCTLSARSEAEEPWAALELDYEIEIIRLEQEIKIVPIETLILAEGPIELDAVADSLLPVTYEVSGPCEIDGTELTPTGVGECELVITQPGDARWGPAEPVTLTIEVTDGPARPTVEVTIDLPRTLRLDDAPLRLQATTVPSRPVTYLAAGSCALQGATTLVPESVGECSVQAVAVGNEDYRRAVASATVSILPRLQTLGLDGVPRTVVLSDIAIPLPATSSAGTPIAYEVTGDCRYSPQGLELTGAGTCQIVASAGGDAETEPVTERFEITITDSTVVRETQTITFAQPGQLVVGGPGVPLSASASSGLTVTLTVTDGECQVSGSTLQPGGAGRCTIVASQLGDAAYEPAESVSRTVTVARLTPTLTIAVTGGSAAEMVEGESRTVTGTVSAGPSASITGTSGPCSTSGASTIVASGTSGGDCEVTVAAPGDTNHNPVSGSVTIRVKVRQTIALSVPSSSIFVGGQVVPEASASSRLAVSVSAGPSGVCTMEGAQVVGTSPGTCTITASQAGNDEFAPASDSVSIDVVARRTPTVSISAPSTAVVGSVVTVTASSSEPNAVITIRASGAACADQGGGSIAAVARGTCTITASHPATPEAEAGSATATIDVTGAIDTISFDCIGPCDTEAGGVVGVAIVNRSGLDIDVSLTGPCRIVQDANSPGFREVVVQTDAPGTCTLTASTAGSPEWEPASNSLEIGVSAIPSSATFELGERLLVGEQRGFDIVHNIPRSVAVASVTSSRTCDVTIDAGGFNGTVVGVAQGPCVVTVKVSGGNYATAEASDTVPVILG